MPNRPVHWYEGMFLRPHHFQAADRYQRADARTADDWFHPFNWGLRSVDIDRDAIASSTFLLRSCELRFKDGTKLAVPSDAEVDAVDLKETLDSSQNGDAIVSLGVPSVRADRANVEPRQTADGPRYWVETVETIIDENTGGDEQEVQFKRVRCRLLLSGQDSTGYEVLPLARVERSAQAKAAPQLDYAFVPPLLVIDAWPPLWRSVQALHYQISARIEQLAAQAVDRGLSFDSQVPGDAERLLKLSVLNGAFSYFESAAYLKGLHPLLIYQELCRLVGQLAIFSENRRPVNLPRYDHDDLGNCFQTVIRQIQLGLETAAPTAFQKRYFEKAGERLQATIEPAWTTSASRLYLGVETELDDQQCQTLLDSMDMKMGSGAQVEGIFRRRLEGLKLTPVTRPPRALPAGAGIIFFQVDRENTFWRDVVDSQTLALRMNLAHAVFEGDRVLVVTAPGSGKTTKLQFALFVI